MGRRLAMIDLAERAHWVIRQRRKPESLRVFFNDLDSELALEVMSLVATPRLDTVDADTD